MDQIPCDVARDLMPLMAEGMASEDSEGLLKQHLSHCPACKAQYDSMGSASAGNIVEQAPLRSLKKALRKRSLRGAFIAVLAALLLLSVLFSSWTARTYVSFEQSGLMLTPSDDGSVLFLSFSNPWAEKFINYIVICRSHYIAISSQFCNLSGGIYASGCLG